MDELPPSNMELLPTVDSPIEAHRRIFNKKVFSMNPDLTFDEEPKKTSKHLTPQQWSEICSVLRSWGPKGSDGKYLKVEAIEDETLKAAGLKSTDRLMSTNTSGQRITFWKPIHSPMVTLRIDSNV